MTTALAPLAVFLILFASAVWVYQDAQFQVRRGTPVYLSVGTFRVDTPAAWLFVCVVLWIIFFPLYVLARGR
jgi:hypothetical protein